MATTFEFCISCRADEADRADQSLARAHALVRRLERKLSEFLPESPIYQLNHCRPHQRVRIDSAALTILELSETIRKKTAGAFDILAKSLPNTDTYSQPPAIAWDGHTGEAWRLTEETRVGFGAIGKGFAIDQAHASLMNDGFSDHWLSAGGSSLIFSGWAGPHYPWQWGWSWEKSDPHGKIRGLRLHHRYGNSVAIGVSGTAEQGNHLLDPRGSRFAHRPLSALIAHPSAPLAAATADAMSTALFVSGWESGQKFIRDEHLSIAAAWVDRDGRVEGNSGFHRLASAAVTFCLMFLARFPISAFAQTADSGEGVDLSALGGSGFTPYIVERNWAWVLLPLFSLTLVLVHLRQRPVRRRKPPSPSPGGSP